MILSRQFSRRFGLNQLLFRARGAKLQFVPRNPDPAPSDDDNDDDDFVPPPFAARLVRVVRTESSEVFILWQDDVRLGQVDLHYGWDIVHATLILEKDLDENAQSELVELIDQDVVSSHLPALFARGFLGHGVSRRRVGSLLRWPRPRTGRRG